MKMQGEEIIAAPRQVVWDALNDPEVLKQCITGCDEIKKKSATEFEAKVTAKVGPVKASFVGNVKMSKLNPPRSYVISGEGKGGIAGFAKGGATVQLSDTADGNTKLSYDVDAQVGGKLAQIGSRLIDSTAKKMAADFFKKFNALVSARALAAESEKKSAPAAKKAPAKKAAAKKATAKTSAAATKVPAASKTAEKKAPAKAPAAKAPAAKAPAAKAPPAKAPAKATAAASKSAVKASVKSEKTTATKAAASKPAKTAAKPAKAAAETAAKPAKASVTPAKAIAKPAAKSASKAAKKSATTPKQGTSSVPAGGSAPSMAPVSNNAAAVTPAAVASAPAQKSSDKVSRPADNVPPQAKAMSSVWLFAMLAAVAGLIVVWAFGRT